MDIDVKKLIGDILAALAGKLKKGWDTVSSFAEKQTKQIVTQAAWITQSRINPEGQLHNDDDLFHWFTDSLEEITANFSRSMAALTLLTLEQAWNAVVTILWGAINTALKAAGLGILSIPVAPAP